MNMNMDMDMHKDFGVWDFALLGRNPICGCPMAIDLSDTLEGRREFEQRGLLLEFCSPGAAMAAWDNASWPCIHSPSRK